jgi:alkanesulfonate monooxygenase SsuD/methylene tetrahydromethanopterin reductase-like flavin-dependent oxidoreductase (luciferase family)
MNPNDGIPLWWARAYTQAAQPNPRTGRWASAEFLGFGGPDSHEAVGTPEDLAGDLAAFLDSLDLTEVLAARQERGKFGVVLEVEPFDGKRPEPRRRELPPVAEDRVPRWKAQASSGNGSGVFDACYGYGQTRGEEGQLVGTAEQVADELAALLAALTKGDVEAMRAGTSRYFVELVVVPGSEGEQG